MRAVRIGGLCGHAHDAEIISSRPFVATALMKSFHNLVCCVACVMPKQMLPFPGLAEPSSQRYSDLVTRMMAVHALFQAFVS